MTIAVLCMAAITFTSLVVAIVENRLACEQARLIAALKAANAEKDAALVEMLHEQVAREIRRSVPAVRVTADGQRVH